MSDGYRNTDSGCPDCDSDAMYDGHDTLSRREFFRQAGLTAAGIAVAGVAAPRAFAQTAVQAVKRVPMPESVVKTMYDSLSPGQKELICMPWEHTLRTKVQNNWAIVKTSVSDFKPDQQEMIHTILRGLTTEEWYPKILDQMKNDAGGIDTYHVAFFGDPHSSKFEWVITGRHVTLRADGHSNANAAFGGPIFYGHAPKDTEAPGHPGNIYWEQGQKANAVFAALDGKQRDLALIAKAPDESQIHLQGKTGQFPGIAIGELSADQKQLVVATMHDMLSPYRPSDARDVMKDIQANGGIDAIHLSFYKQDALGQPGVWDIWRLEGPSVVWHFRGAPHVHTWVNVVLDVQKAEYHV